MAALFPYQYINVRGIPTIKTTGVRVNTDSVDFVFNSNPSFSNPFRGLLLVYISEAIPAGTTTTLPIRFTSSAGTENVTTYNDVNWTVGDVLGTGVYLVYYDRRENTLQVLSV